MPSLRYFLTISLSLTPTSSGKPQVSQNPQKGGEKERSGRFPEFFCFPGSSEPAFRYFELNLTSDHAAIYHPGRWDEAKSAHESSLSQRRGKRISYKLYYFFSSGGTVVRLSST